MSSDPDEPMHLPVDGMLDLHTFKPQDVRNVIDEYFRECRALGILRVRIIHGKGIGNLRRTVHAHLRRDLGVAGFHLAHECLGGWGATIVQLKP